MRILVVEDSEVNREFLLAILEDFGQPVGADSAEDALELFRDAHREKNPFELVFMDIMLPGMDGLQAIEEIRALETAEEIPPPSRAKVLVASALDNDSATKRAFFQGSAVSYITKPLTREKIRAEMEKLGLHCELS